MSLEATLATWELTKSEVNSREKFLLLSLARRAGEDHTCWPSVARIVADTGLDRKTIIEVRQSLIDKKFISYTGKMYGRSKQIPEMMLDYVDKWEQKRNSPRLKDDDEPVNNSGVVNINNPKNGTGTHPKNGTGTSPKNGTLNSTLENNNRNKSSYASHEIKKNNPVDNHKTERITEPERRALQKAENEKRHSWADKRKSDAPLADVTKQSTSYDPEKYKDSGKKANPEVIRQAMMCLPASMIPKRHLVKSELNTNVLRHKNAIPL